MCIKILFLIVFIAQLEVVESIIKLFKMLCTGPICSHKEECVGDVEIKL